MALKFNNAWRFNSPEDGRFRDKAIPGEAIEEFFGLASKVATQGVRFSQRKPGSACNLS